MSKNRNKSAAVAIEATEEVSLEAALREIETDEVSLTDTSAVEAVTAEIESIEAKQAAAAESEVETPAAASVPSTKPAKAPKVKKERTPRVSMTAGQKASEVIRATVDTATLSQLLSDDSFIADEAAVNDVLAKIDTLDKKSREKATNLFGAIKAGKKPSVYVMHTLEVLGAEAVNAKGLTDAFLARGYKIGTARRQASEMFALLPVTRLTIRDGGRGSAMSVNKSSGLYKAIKAA